MSWMRTERSRTVETVEAEEFATGTATAAAGAGPDEGGP